MLLAMLGVSGQEVTVFGMLFISLMADFGAAHVRL
jgi:hypothetical protein